jgi:cardiolipin synthase
MNPVHEAEYKWMHSGAEVLDQMLEAIGQATRSVRLEMYIFHASPIADSFREALVEACKRGVQVKVLLDAFGSAYLSNSFWDPFRAAGGEFRWFNPLNLHHVFIRDHRKMLVCDEEVAFIGGLNIAKEYHGDGVEAGWRDLGLKLRGPLVEELAAAFDDMFRCADFKHRPFTRLRKSARQKIVTVSDARLLLGGPGRHNPFKTALLADLRNACEVLAISPYFIPPWRIRRRLMRLAHGGAKIQLILPSKSDIPIVRLASQSFYRRFMAAGVEIYEYQPQILHAKLIIVDDLVYAGSANLDARSWNINYELMVRLSNSVQVQEARQIFSDVLAHCHRIDFAAWRNSRTFLDRIKGRFAHFILARVDSFFASRQFRWWRLSLARLRAAKKHKPISQQQIN